MESFRLILCNEGPVARLQLIGVSLAGASSRASAPEDCLYLQ